MKKSYDKPRRHVKKQRHHLETKGSSSQGYGFSSSRVWMWELDNEGGRALKNWCFHVLVLEKTLESPLDCKEIKPVNPKRNQPWIVIGRTDAEAEAPIFWPPDMENWLTGKDPDAGKDWRQEKGTTGWDGWMASPMQWTWVWASSGSWRWTGKSGMLQSMGVTNSRTQLSNWTKYNAQSTSQFILIYKHFYSTYCLWGTVLGLQALTPKSLTQSYDLSIISIIP